MKRLGKRPGILAFTMLGVYLLMYLIPALGGISTESAKLIEGMSDEVGTLLTMLIVYAVKDEKDAGAMENNDADK